MADIIRVLDSYTCTYEDHEAGQNAYARLQGNNQLPYESAELMVRYNGDIYNLSLGWATWTYGSTYSEAEIHYNQYMHFEDGDEIELIQIEQNVTAYMLECRVCTNDDIYDSSGGTTQGSGDYEAGSTVTAFAIPNAGYEFVEWMYGGPISSLNPYSFTLNSNTVLYACFRSLVNIYDLHFYSYTSDDVTNMPDDIQLVSGQNTIPSNIPRRKDYKFLGWALNTDLDTAESMADQQIVSTYSGDVYDFSDVTCDWYAVAIWKEAEYYNVTIHTEGGFSNDTGSKDDIELQFEVIDVESQPTFEGLDFVPIKYSYRLLGIYDENNNAVFTESGHPITGIYFDGWSRWRYTGSNRNITLHAVWESEQFIYDDQKHRLIYSGGHSSYEWDDNL